MYLCFAGMEVDCNLKKLANFFKFFLFILEKSLKTDYSSFFLGEKTKYFLLGVERAIHVQTRFFVKYLGIRDSAPLTKFPLTEQHRLIGSQILKFYQTCERIQMKIFLQISRCCNRCRFLNDLILNLFSSTTKLTENTTNTRQSNSELTKYLKIPST